MNIDDHKNVSFENVSIAFASKTKNDLKRAKFLFKIFESRFMVKLFSKLTLFFMSIGVPIKNIIRKTIYKQFCAGETLDESKSIIQKLNEFKIHSILDYSVEGTGNEEDFERTKNEIIKIILFAKKNKAVPYTCLKFTGIAPFSFLSENKRKEKGAIPVNLRQV